MSTNGKHRKLKATWQTYYLFSKSEWVDAICHEIASRKVLQPMLDEQRRLYDAVVDALPEEMHSTFVELVDLKDNNMFEAISLAAEMAPVVKRKFKMRPTGRLLGLPESGILRYNPSTICS